MRYKYILIGIVVGVLLSSVAAVLAGQIDSPAGPTESAAQMYTLQQIYDRLNDGTAATKMKRFTEPSSGPGSTMHTLNEIMAKAPAVDYINGAGLRDVQAGKTYWGLTGGNWGLQTGKGTGVPLTGQTGCWNWSGDSIDCAGTGQDGEYQLGHLPVGDPGLLCRFTDNGNGTVTDNLTRLVWLEDASCSDLAYTDVHGTGAWEMALWAANALAHGTCGLSDGSSAGDWRLPNINELHSLVVGSGQTEPALPPDHPFSGVEDWGGYWSSTSYSEFPGYAWNVDHLYGYAGYGPKLNAGFVWPVRCGQ